MTIRREFRHYTTEEIEKLCTYWKAGVTPGTIAAMMGRKQTAICHKIHKLRKAGFYLPYRYNVPENGWVRRKVA